MKILLVTNKTQKKNNKNDSYERIVRGPNLLLQERLADAGPHAPLAPAANTTTTAAAPAQDNTQPEALNTTAAGNDEHQEGAHYGSNHHASAEVAATHNNDGNDEHGDDTAVEGEEGDGGYDANSTLHQLTWDNADLGLQPDASSTPADMNSLLSRTLDDSQRRQSQHDQEEAEQPQEEQFADNDFDNDTAPLLPPTSPVPVPASRAAVRTQEPSTDTQMSPGSRLVEEITANAMAQVHAAAEASRQSRETTSAEQSTQKMGQAGPFAAESAHGSDESRATLSTDTSTKANSASATGEVSTGKGSTKKKKKKTTAS